VDAYGLDRLTRCRRCPRLVRYREGEGAPRGPKHLVGLTYWARPVPGFGDPRAAILLLGLAPGYHGANRTGRPFTGDWAGDFMWPILHRLGLANRPQSLSRDDGFRLRGLWITSAVKCAPPANRPTPRERATCLPYLDIEIIDCLHTSRRNTNTGRLTEKMFEAVLANAVRSRRGPPPVPDRRPRARRSKAPCGRGAGCRD